MKWLHDARTKIEKRGDLELHGFVRAEILASHLDTEVPRMEVPADLFELPKAVLGSLPRAALAQHILKHGTLRIRRRWVENNWPSHELLDALAVAYGRVTEIVHDAHSKLDLPPPRVADDETGEPFDLSAIGWRMPCMVAHEARRELLIALADGSSLSLRRRSIELDADSAQSLSKKLDSEIYGAMGVEYASDEDLSDAYFGMARKVFERDGYHIPLLFLFRGTKPLRFMPYEIENQAAKYVVMRALADEALRCGADVAI